MARVRTFIQCDVFTDTPTYGNGLAVVVDAAGLTDTDMQAFAAWTNLAETTFIFPPEDPSADYKLRIFTPGREMPFAGHPTLGSCAAWLHTGGQPKDPDIVRQECAIGIVEIDQTGSAPAFVAPPTRIDPMPQADFEDITATLELDPATIRNNAVLENGPVWKFFELDSADAVLAVDGRKVRWPTYFGIGLIGPHDHSAPYDYEVRMLAPSSGMLEDPITGSFNAAVACWLQAQDRLPSEILMRQGTTIGRQGRVYISRDKKDPDRVLIGGETQILIEGTVRLWNCRVVHNPNAGTNELTCNVRTETLVKIVVVKR